MGGFATTLITVSFAMMNLRDVSVQTLNIGNLCFVASVGLLISAQWEMARGNTFSYTTLSAYGISTLLPSVYRSQLLIAASLRPILWRVWLFVDSNS